LSTASTNTQSLIEVDYQSINQSINHLLAILTWGKTHREYNQYKWQVQTGRNCTYSWPLTAWVNIGPTHKQTDKDTDQKYNEVVG